MKTIHPIFTKRKTIFEDKKPNNSPKIIIDYREKNSLVNSELIKLGLKTEFKELKIGDYIANNVVIERKTVQDFISSMINRHLLNQLEELKQFENKLLIIEGINDQELYPENSYAISPEAIGNRRSVFRGKSKKTSGLSSNGINPQAIRGFLLSILIKHKIPTLMTLDYKDTAQFINRIARKKYQEMTIRPNKKTLNKKEQQQFILEGFPGIGPKLARRLIKEFKTIKNIINASKKELESVLGKKSESITKFID